MGRHQQPTDDDDDDDDDDHDDFSLIAIRYRVLIVVKKGFWNVSAGGHGARVSDPRRERLPSAISSESGKKPDQNRIRAGF